MKLLTNLGGHCPSSKNYRVTKKLSGFESESATSTQSTLVTPAYQREPLWRDLSSKKRAGKKQAKKTRPVHQKSPVSHPSWLGWTHTEQWFAQGPGRVPSETPRRYLRVRNGRKRFEMIGRTSMQLPSEKRPSTSTTLKWQKLRSKQGVIPLTNLVQVHQNSLKHPSRLAHFFQTTFPRHVLLTIRP